MKKFIIFLFTLCVISLAAMFALKTIQPPESGSDGSSTESVYKPNESKPDESNPSIDVGDYEDWILTLDWNGSTTAAKEFRITKDMWKKKSSSGTEEIKVSKIVLSEDGIVFGD